MSRAPIHPAGDPADRALIALYRKHLGADAGDASHPSAGADARIRALARDSIAMARPAPPAAKPAQSGWKSWVGASWFKPSLAFATLASLSVAIVALMPRDDLDIERAETAATMSAPAPASAPTPASAPAPASASASDTRAPSAAPDAPTSSARASTSRATESQQATIASKQSVRESAVDNLQAAPARQSRKDAPMAAATQPPATEPLPARAKARMAEQDDAATRSRPAAPAPASRAPAAPPPAVPPAPVSAASSAASAPPALAPPPAPAASSESAAVSSPATQGPNPFPAQQPMPADRRADKSVQAGAPSAAPPAAPAGKPSAAPAATPSRQSMALGAAADASAPQRVEKPSLQSEPAEYRANTQPLPEVRDSAPTYPHEARPSVATPNAPALQRPQQPATGYASEMARSQSTLSAARKEEALQKRAYEGTSPMTAPPRNPAEWIRAILKLKSDGKNEQVLKELVEFRKHYPAYPLPEELKPLAAAK